MFFHHLLCQSLLKKTIKTFRAKLLSLFPFTSTYKSFALTIEKQDIFSKHYIKSLKRVYDKLSVICSSVHT